MTLAQTANTLVSSFGLVGLLLRPLSPGLTNQCQQILKITFNILSDLTVFHSQLTGAVSGDFLGQEDCLTLNIYSPADVFHSQNSSHPLAPVLVWIYGGGFLTGSARSFYCSVVTLLMIISGMVSMVLTGGWTKAW